MSQICSVSLLVLVFLEFMNEFIEKLRRHAGLTVSVHLDFICSFVPPNLEEKQ